MPNTTCFAIITSVLFVLSCSRNNDNNPVTNPVTSPVETNPANTTYTPAFQGQTRINGVQTTTPYQGDIITSALTSPWGIANLPDGRFLITLKAGQMCIVTSAGVVSNPITGIPAVNNNGQGGLLDVCIDPDFASNRMVYWTFIRSVGGGNAVAVAKGRLSNDETVIESPNIIYNSTTASAGTVNYGSRIIFDSTGNLLVSFGDLFTTGIRIEAQSVSSSIGKVLRITTNGSAAPGNPVFSQPGALPGLYTMGHRNPQGLAIHPVTGDIWESEHGPRGGDEINRLQPGSNYGWPIISYGIEYSGQAVGAGIQQQEGMEQPVYYWDPVVSPSGITFYSGNKVPEWENNLFLCSLTQTHIIRLVIENNRVTGEERLLADQNQRFRDITQGSDSALYAITDAGRLYRIDRH
jgi:glucose/arabinose dehydrogenase